MQQQTKYRANGQRRRNRQRGAALLTTLIAIAISSVLAAAIATLVVSHNSRVYTDRDAATALNFAEGAMNVQVQKISANLGKTQVKYGGSNLSTATYGVHQDDPDTGTYYPVDSASLPTPLTGYLTGLDTTRGDYVRAWVWPSPLKIYNEIAGYTPQYIYGEAKINGVTRTVRAKAGSVGIFDKYALFGISNVQLGNNMTINGGIGTNGTISAGTTINGATGVILAGPDAVSAGTITSPAVSTQATAVPFPTIFELANDVAAGVKERITGGLSVPAYASTISATNGIRNFYNTATSTAYNDNNSAIYTDRNGVTITTGFPLAGNIPSNNNLKLVGKEWGANYYMNGINVQGTMNVDLTDGPVNLWIDSQATNGDTVAGNFTVTAPRITDQFRIYYRNPRPNGKLSLNGGGSTPVNVQAYVYVYDKHVYTSAMPVADGGTLGTPFGKFDATGNVSINGAVIAYDAPSLNGNVTITLPSNPGAQPGEGLLFYGLLSPWQEILPVRGN